MYTERKVHWLVLIDVYREKRYIGWFSLMYTERKVHWMVLIVVYREKGTLAVSD